SLFPEVNWEGTTFSEFLRAVDRHGYVTNYAPLVGHGSVRAAAIGLDSRPASSEEIVRMQASVREAIDAGAFGVSTGLIYPPGSNADTDELVMICEALPRHAVYATHMRNESNRVRESVEEAIAVAERSGVSLQISHHKVMGRRNWGMTSQTLAMIT